MVQWRMKKRIMADEVAIAQSLLPGYLLNLVQPFEVAIAYKEVIYIHTPRYNLWPNPIPEHNLQSARI